MWLFRSMRLVAPVALVFAVSVASLQAADDVPDGSPKELIKYIQKAAIGRAEGEHAGRAAGIVAEEPGKDRYRGGQGAGRQTG